MPLTLYEIEELWHQRMNILSLRNPNWIFQSVWVMPLALIVPVMAANFSIEIIHRSAIASLAYGCYAIITYWIWHSGNLLSPLPLSRRRLIILFVMGYDGLTLLFLSNILLLTATLGVTYLPFPNDILVATAISLYLAATVFLLVRAPHILSYMIQSSKHPLAPEMRWALGSQSAIIGIGVGLGVVFSKNTLGVVLWVGASLSGAFLLLPFSLIALYQVFSLAQSIKRKI